MKLVRVLRSDLLFVTLILCFTALHFWLNLNSIRLNLFDETLYLQRGAGTNEWIDSNWAPLYSMFYRVLSFAVEDRFQLYVLAKYICNCLLFPFSIYSFTRKLRQKPLTAFLASAFLYLTWTNVDEAPRVHVFNISLLLLNYIFFYDAKSLVRIALFSLFMGLSLHIRSENIVGFTAFMILSTSISFFRNRYKKAVKTSLAFTIPFVVGLYSISWDDGRPLLNSKNRTIKAFEDHYVWRNPDTTPTLAEFYKLYPKGDSLGNYILNYPSQFYDHVLKNLLDLPEKLSTSLTLRDRSQDRTVQVMIFFICAFLLGGSFIFSRRSLVPLGFLLCITLQSVLLGLLFQPWIIYLLPMSIFFFLVLLFLSGILLRMTVRSEVLRAGLAFLVLTYFARILVLDWDKREESGEELVVLKKMRTMDIRKDDIVLFPNLLPYYARTGDPAIPIATFEFIRFGQKFSTYNEWVSHERITVFCDSSSFKTDSFLGIDTHYEEFKKNIRTYNFVELPNGSDLLRCYARR